MRKRVILRFREIAFIQALPRSSDKHVHALQQR